MMHSAFVELKERVPLPDACLTAVASAYSILCTAFDGGGKLLLCGNGGSCADAAHVAGELVNRFEKSRPLSKGMRERLLGVPGGSELTGVLQASLPALLLDAGNALGTAIANDATPEVVFAQQVMAFAKQGDVLLCITTSGNSENVLNAARVARALGVRVIGLTGPGGGRLTELADVLICLPGERTADVQERHLPVYHALCRALEQRYFPETD